MNLNQFKQLLSENLEKPFQIILPTGNLVPMSFHVTEIGLVTKKFLDCGGTLREQKTCQLQVWLGADEDHRLNAQKLLGIIKKGETTLGLADLPIEIEYEDLLISQYTIGDSLITSEAVLLTLASKHTDCLAKELCGGVAPEASSCCADVPKVAGKCCGPSGC